MTAVQQYRSTFLAQPRRRIVLEGEDGGDGEPKVAITMGASSSRACGAVGAASECFSEILVWLTSSRVWVKDREGIEKGKVAEGRVIRCTTSFRVQARTACHTRLWQKKGC